MSNSELGCLSVGKPYPLAYPKTDRMVPFLDGTFLTFIVSLAGISLEEEAVLREGPMWYGLYAHKNIPFVPAKFGNILEFDAYLNIHLESLESRTNFLSEEGMDANILQYHIVDSQTGILRVMRVLGALERFLPAVKRVCTEQRLKVIPLRLK